jgi:CRISPR-associated protein Cas2
MLVIVLEGAPPKLRGELTRWLMETKPGVFVGKTSALVRQKLWDKVKENTLTTGALMIYSSDTEQGYAMEMYGEPTRRVVDLEGIQLIKTS